MEAKYTPKWQEDFWTADEFGKKFDRFRDVFEGPFSATYRHLKRTEIPNGRVLSLGIGNGTIERMLGLDQNTLEAVDINPHLLKRAQNRFPKARMHLGRFQHVLPKKSGSRTH
jgi:ubiquinone/menaquinone biosynthesis C-methylase UbiE